MTAEEKISSPQKPSIILSPCLVILGALLLYGFTLDHWVTFSSLPVISKVTGWDWHPLPLSWRQTQVAPLFFVLTCPVRLLPAAWQPAALNAFAAICAALTLGLLAASVRLLPYDRTREQRQREGGEFSLLSVPAAFLPPLLAVLILGLQLTFWRSAISATGDMLDVLVFAALIFCLLKFRISQNDNWLSGFAFIYGLGATNNWALLGFFPFFLVAMVWIKGINFFNGRFLARVAGCGALGLLLYLLIPAIGSLGSERANFLTLLHMELGAQSFGLRLVPRWIVAVAALPTLLPLIFAGIKWPSFAGELSAAGNAMTKFMFHLLHVVFLLLALLLFFDFKYSPSLRLQDVPEIKFLTFYYMGALCVGYYSGYTLLIFGKNAPQSWEKPRLVAGIINRIIVGFLLLLAVAAPCGLFYESISHINAGKSNALADFFRETIQDLPAKPVIILSDDSAQLYLLEAAFRREGKPNKNILIETASLPHREYIAYLISRYPELQKLTANPGPLAPVLPAEALVKYLYGLSLHYSIYYLHPSFGYFFEVFYLKPHGLVYEVQRYPTQGDIEAPQLTSQEIRENQDVWTKLEKTSLTALPSMAKLDPDAATISGHYSVALNYWAVELQKAGYLLEANALFAEAVRIHPQNFIAAINKEYNERLQKNDHRPIDTRDLIYKAINVYHGMVPILKYNGPVDEPGLILDFGKMIAEGHDYRQAAILFNRRLQLLPGDASAELDLAKTYVDGGQPDKAIELVRKLHANPAANKWDVSRVEALAYFAKRDFPTTEKLMLNAFKEDPRDGNRAAMLADFYLATAKNALRETNAAEAGHRFTNALTYLNQELQLFTPDGHNSADQYGVPDALLKKAEVEMMLKSFDAAIATLTQVVELQPKNPTAVLNRAMAEVQLNQIPAAKDDCKALSKLLPDRLYMVDYLLADIADREKNPAEESRCLKRYLESAPKNSPEFQQANRRLKRLESLSP